MANIYENKALRNQRRVFKDRFDAGRVLARMLESEYAKADDVIILSIPMGGLPVAAEIAAALECPMDLIIVRKIQIPGNTEAGFGAMTHEGDLFLNEPLLAGLGLTQDQVNRQSGIVREELERRNRRLRRGRPFPDVQGKTVILADDGLASGFTMKASVFMTTKRKAAKTVVAVPTAPLRTIEALSDGTDEIYCPNIRDVLSFAVADAYKNWHDLSEAEARALIPDPESAEALRQET